jgi:peptide/nickel transport system substrate-binding protein
MKRHLRWVLLTLGVVSLLDANGQASAAPRARYGGTVRIGTSDWVREDAPTLADRPLEVAVRSLHQLPLCRLDDIAVVEPVLLQRTEVQNGRVALHMRPRPEGATGDWVSPEDVARFLESVAQGVSPYRALLASLRNNDGRMAIEVSGNQVRASRTHSWPDLDSALCHPALWLGQAQLPGGPFRRNNDMGTANPFHPRGRPFVDAFRLVAQQERTASRLFRLKQLDIVMGGGAQLPRGYPYATYLGLSPERNTPNIRALLETVIDRQELTRSFVRAPAIPLRSALPPFSNDAPTTAPARGPSASGSAGLPPALTLIFDASNEDARAVAERLQLKLRNSPIKLALRALSRAELWREWAAGVGFDLAVLSILMPPQPANALSLLLELGATAPLRTSERAALGNIADASARTARAEERARALMPTLPLLPLYAQGLPVVAGDRVRHLTLDAQGIPRLDDVWLVGE